MQQKAAEIFFDVFSKYFMHIRRKTKNNFSHSAITLLNLPFSLPLFYPSSPSLPLVTFPFTCLPSIPVSPSLPLLSIYSPCLLPFPLAASLPLLPFLLATFLPLLSSSSLPLPLKSFPTLDFIPPP